MEPAIPDNEKRIALLIDADDAPASKIDVILAEGARHGEANVRRAYGHWKRQHLNGWEQVLHTYALRPLQQFAYSTGKNRSKERRVRKACVSKWRSGWTRDYKKKKK